MESWTLQDYLYNIYHSPFFFESFWCKFAPFLQIQADVCQFSQGDIEFCKILSKHLRTFAKIQEFWNSDSKIAVFWTDHVRNFAEMSQKFCRQFWKKLSKKKNVSVYFPQLVCKMQRERAISRKNSAFSAHRLREQSGSFWEFLLNSKLTSDWRHAFHSKYIEILSRRSHVLSIEKLPCDALHEFAQKVMRCMHQIHEKLPWDSCIEFAARVTALQGRSKMSPSACINKESACCMRSKRRKHSQALSARSTRHRHKLASQWPQRTVVFLIQPCGNSL